MMKILLLHGKYALVDDEDFEGLSKFKWYISRQSPRHFKVIRNLSKKTDGRTGTMALHRQITQAPKGRVVDHINHNTLDNRRANLRVCGQSENMFNARVGRNNTSGFRGISWSKTKKKWLVHISNNHLGYFETLVEARREYKRIVSPYLRVGISLREV